MDDTPILKNSEMKTRTTLEAAKRAAAYTAGEREIFSGCRLGVGSGSTAKYLIEFLAERIKNGLLSDIICVPSSFQTNTLLVNAGIHVSSLEQTPVLDLCIDGADEVDDSLNCIKGGGGCLTREKIVQSCAKRFYIIADSRKDSKVLGEKYPTIPIEVIPFGHVPIAQWIKREEGGEPVLRMSSKKCGPVITDNHNYILDWHFPKGKYLNTSDWAALHHRLINFPGIVETGLFIGVAEKAYFASLNGTVNVKDRHV